mmetsp:Transcript_33876/g.24919  ORF Transcript_33876/g.24919 Transcript_33876/m.24919 type:complete len:250 (+) Transcript_33876:3741-4490(+)
MCVASFWLDPEDEHKVLTTPIKESDIILEFVDIPSLHSYNDISEAFFDALEEVENMDFFSTKAITKFIDFKWPLVFHYTVRKLFIPFLVYMVAYVLFMSWIYLKRYESLGWEYTSYVFMAILILYSLYFCFIEISQIREEGPKYLTSVWNYLDMVPPFFLLVFIPLAYEGYFEDPAHKSLEASMQGIMSLFIWLKMLYFLRIFDQTGYLVRIIIEVIYDMRYFLMILILTFVAFADSYYQINTSNTADN